MYIAHDYGLVRIVHDGSPFDKKYDIRVEWRESNESEWTLFSGYNSLSNDYAFSEANRSASIALAELAKKKASANISGG
jgi:hypothetical protein